MCVSAVGRRQVANLVRKEEGVEDEDVTGIEGDGEAQGGHHDVILSSE